MTSLFSEEKLISKGAEASISSAIFLDQSVIIKHRFEKKYRNKDLDYKLRKERSAQEIRLLQLARMQKVNVPVVLDIDKISWKITMEKIDGSPIKLLENMNIESTFRKVGIQIGRLHLIEIIHGDLTTSNLIVTLDDQVYVIDFGLGYRSNHLEDKAVDLLVLKHILESSHPKINETAFNAVKVGYSSVVENASSIYKRMNVVEGRVRYKTHD